MHWVLRQWGGEISQGHKAYNQIVDYSLHLYGIYSDGMRVGVGDKEVLVPIVNSNLFSLLTDDK